MNVKSTNNELYIGIGMIVVLSITMILIVKKLKKKTIEINIDAFDSPDQKGSGKCMDKDFLNKLVKLSELTKLPIFRMINSGARSSYWNTKVGGVRNSSHKIPVCKAADIKAPNKRIRDMIVHGARQVGFKRIGVGRTFVHLDNDENKKQYVAWGYPSGTKPPINPFV